MLRVLQEEKQREQNPVRVNVIDIATSEELVDRYGIRIPVLVNIASDSELGWPFQYQDIVNLI